MSSGTRDNPWHRLDLQSIHDKAYTEVSRRHPDDVTLDLLRGPSPTPYVAGAMGSGEDKDFWFTPSHSMIIVICVGSVAILIGILALVWKYVLKDGSTRERCRIRKRPSRSTPKKELYKHQHSLGVYASVQADNCTTDFHYEFEGPDGNNLNCASPDSGAGSSCASPGSQGSSPIQDSTPHSMVDQCDGGCDDETAEGMKNTAGCVTSTLY